MGYQPFGQYRATPDLRQGNHFDTLYAGTFWLAKEMVLTASTVIRSTNYVAGISGFRLLADGSAEFNNLSVAGYSSPLGMLGYSQITSDVGGISTVADLTTVTVTVTASRILKITGQMIVWGNTAGGIIRGYIREGTTVLGGVMEYEQVAAGDASLSSGGIVLVPSAGSHTYKLSVDVTAGACQVAATTTRPTWLLVEDLGAA